MKFNTISIFITALIGILLLSSCNHNDDRLPILGTPTIKDNDTIYPTIQSFRFINQDGSIITENTFYNKIYVADFIFLSCPTICPKMTTELKTVYDTFENNSNILFISHTIDPEHDTIPRLKEYATNLHIDTKKWFFVTGLKDSIHKLAENSYFSAAYADKMAPGGYVHSGGLLLVDKNKHIRGVYDGTDPIETKRLIKDIDKLLVEQFKN